MTPLRSLLYVSRRVVVPDLDAAVARIVETSLARNRALDVTGALIATDALFAQVLEGPDEAIAELMISIRRDPRHQDLSVAFDEPIAQRRFADWALAYRGGAGFVSRLVSAVATGAAAAEDPDRRRLIRFMEGMAIG